MNARYGYILVEGQTEERFVNLVLGPHLAPRLFLTPIIVETSRRPSGGALKGGFVRYPKFRNQLTRLLQDPTRQFVTTLFDLYGLPADFPGLDSIGSERGAKKAEALERALDQDLGSSRLIPYLSVHEFEALVLAADKLESVPALYGAQVSSLRKMISNLDPEDIDDGPTTHPSARLAAIQGYDKAAHGWLITQRAGLPALRDRCPHFDAWVGRLETIAAGS